MVSLRTRSRAVFSLLLLTACEGGPSGTDGRDPLANQKFAELTPETLRNGILPEGYRLGDRAPATPAKTAEEPSPTPPWRESRDPNPATLFVAARGKDSRVDYVQWVFEGDHRPSIELVTGAGIQLGEVVALGRARPRNWGRLSQGHALDERFEVFVQRTDREHFYVQRIGYDGALDSLVWAATTKELLDQDERFDVAIARRELEAAMASRVEATVAKYRYWLRAVTDPTLKAQVDAAEGLLAAWAKEHDDPIVAKLEAIRRRHDDAWKDANDDTRVRLWAADHDEATTLWQKLKRAKCDVPAHIHAAWQAFARERNKAAGGALPDSAKGFYWRYVLAAPRSYVDVVNGWVRANELDSAESMYFQTADLRTRLAEGNEPLLPATPEVDQVVRRLLARQLRREADADRANGHALRADWIEHGVLLALEHLAVPTTHRYPFVTGAEYLKTWNEVTKYEALVTSGARAGLRVQAINAMAAEEAKAGAERAQRTGFALTFMTDFVGKQRTAIAGELRKEAEAAAARGHFATATVHALQADDVLLQAPAAVQSVAAEPAAGSVLHHARHFLARVLPPIDGNTAQGWRLCELLAEGDTTEWPLVRDLAVRIEPDDVPKLRAALGLPATFAHLVRTGDDAIALVQNPKPSDPKTDERFWAAYSGRSSALLEESKWISGEGAWLRPEGEWIGTEKAAVEVLHAQLEKEVAELDRDFEAHKRLRDSVNTYDETAVRAYNATGNDLENRKTQYNKKAEASRTRVGALNARVKAHSDRVAVYNRRLAAYNEACMREDAGGLAALDAKLKPALVAALREALATWEADVLATSPNSLARDMEILFGKALLGQHESRPELWTRPVGKGYARIVADSILRAGPRQSTNREYARHVATWWTWAVVADVPDRELVLDLHLDEFIAHRDSKELATVIREAVAGNPAQRDFLLRRLEERRVKYFERK